MSGVFRMRRVYAVLFLLVLTSLCVSPEEPVVEPSLGCGDCDDNNPCTTDFCDETGTCRNLPLDGRVEGCQDDTGPCSLFICASGVCKDSRVRDCCGNLICEESENFGNCEEDCNRPLTAERYYSFGMPFAKTIVENDTTEYVTYNTTQLRVIFKSQYNRTLKVSSKLDIDICDTYNTKTGYILVEDGIRYWLSNVTIDPTQELTSRLTCSYYVKKVVETEGGNKTEERSVVVFPHQDVSIYTVDDKLAAIVKFGAFMVPNLLG